MLSLERHGDVTRVRMTTWRGRLVGYDVSAYVVRGLLVDSGFPRAAGDLSRFLDHHPVRGAIVTHWHEDHAGNTALVAARGLPITIAPLTLQQLRGPAAASLPFYRRFVWGVAPPVSSTVAQLESDTLRVVHAPGHSPDHHVVWDEERATLLGLGCERPSLTRTHGSSSRRSDAWLSCDQNGCSTHTAAQFQIRQARYVRRPTGSRRRSAGSKPRSTPAGATERSGVACSAAKE
jgi:hypothetical protein